MDDIISDADIRRELATHRLGASDHCHICEERDPRCLELHHIAGQAHHDDLVAVCRNCHRKLSDDQLDHPKAQTLSSTQVIGQYLMGLADFFIALAHRLKEMGQMLIGHEMEVA